MREILRDAEGTLECVTCGHEWQAEGHGPDDIGEVRDANGNVLANGDTVTLTKDLKLKGSSTTLKVGTKFASIRLVPGDHQIDAKADGRGILLKAEFVKKV